MTETDLTARRNSIDAEDPSVPHHLRFRPREQLAVELQARGPEDRDFQAAVFESMIFFCGVTHELPPYDRFPEQLRTPAGLAWAELQVQGFRSPMLRALAGWLIWLSEERRFRRHASKIATSFLEWFDVVAGHALAVDAHGAGREAVHVLSAAADVIRQTGQRHLLPRLLTSALEFGEKASTSNRRRWRLDVGRLVAELPAEALKAHLPRVIELVRHLEETSAAFTDSFFVHVGFLRAATQLRIAVGLPESSTHGPLAVARFIENDAMQGPALRRVSCLRSTIAEYQKLPGQEETIARLRLQLEDDLRQAHAELKPMVTTTTVPREVMDAVNAIVTHYAAADFGTALDGLGRDPNFRIDVDDLTAEATAADGEFLHRQLFPATMFEGDGTTVRPSTEEGQRLLRLRNDAAFQQHVRAGLFLRPIFTALRERGMTSEQMVQRICDGTLFEPTERPLVEVGLKHWLAGDWFSALSTLVPRTERVLRRMAERLGQSTIVVREDGDQRAMLSTVVERLSAVAIGDAARSLFFELGVFLDGGGGQGVRHQVAHGLAEPSFFTRDRADTLVGLLLRLSAMRGGSAGDAG